MPILELDMEVAAPAERVFDLTRSVDAHIATSGSTGERPVGGVTTGLMELGDEVTWSARHLGLRWRLTSRITGFERPNYFRDSMAAGVFQRFDHDHWFESKGATTRVREVFDFTSPLGLLGDLANALVVTRHMRNFLEHRAQGLKELAESDGWKRFVGG